MPRPSYTPAEHRSLAETLHRGAAPVCPVCACALDRRRVPPRGDVSYVRERVWLVCPRCHRSTFVDRSEDR